MSLRSTAIRFGIVAAGGALTALAATAPALAAGASHNDSTFYKGRVTARTGLLLRDAPNRGGAVVRSVPYNSIVSIYCKTKGENVLGNRLWYLLPDGSWAWGSAKYIANVGPAPRWC